MISKVLISNDNEVETSVEAHDGSRFILSGVYQKCGKCRQAIVDKGSTVVLDVPEGYRVKIVKEDEKVE